jgi:hypothetical protein
LAVGSVDEDFQKTNLLSMFSFTDSKSGELKLTGRESAFTGEPTALPIRNPVANIVKINEPTAILLRAKFFVKCFGINVLFL